MKSVINILLMGACFLCSAAFAAEPDSFCLRIEGKILTAGVKGAAGCTIELLCDGREVERTLLSSPKKKFGFNLVKNKQYTLRMSQDGYIPKVITINTNLPLFLEDDYGFFFETSLIQETEMPNLNQEVVQQPVARISFDMRRMCFYYDKQYSENIKKELITRR